MGILASVAEAVFAKTAGPNDQEGWLTSILGLIEHPDTGGLPGLVEKFKAAGMGEMAKAWVGNGPNPPVTADQLQQVFSSDQLRAFAQKLGIDPDVATKHLADLLPHVVDSLTPNGTLPQGQVDTAAMLAALKSKLFGS